MECKVKPRDTQGVKPQDMEELKPEYRRLVTGQVICKYGFELFHGQLDMSLRLRDSVRNLRWAVLVEGLAIAVLLFAEFVI